VDVSDFFHKFFKKLVFGVQFVVIFLKFQKFLKNVYVFESFVSLKIQKVLFFELRAFLSLTWKVFFDFFAFIWTFALLFG